MYSYAIKINFSCICFCIYQAFFFVWCRNIVIESCNRYCAHVFESRYHSNRWKMTIMQSEKLKHGQQEKGCRNFHENFDLNVTAQELEQQPDLQWELLENHCSQYSEFSGNMEKHRDNLSMEAPKLEEQVPQTKTFEGCVDQLLVLAQSAEIVAAQSEDSVAGTRTHNQNKGKY